MRRSIIVVGIALVLGTPRGALADDAGAARPSKEVADLIGQIDHDEAMLATEGCAIACQALTSMRRAVERLCDLDAGARCTAARDRVRGAEERVRSTCPECGVATGMPSPVVAVSPAREPGDAPAAPNTNGNKPSTADEIQVRGGRGCAGCAVARDERPEGWLAALVASVTLAGMRRRRRARADRGR